MSWKTPFKNGLENNMVYIFNGCCECLYLCVLTIKIDEIPFYIGLAKVLFLIALFNAAVVLKQTWLQILIMTSKYSWQNWD